MQMNSEDSCLSLEEDSEDNTEEKEDSGDQIVSHVDIADKLGMANLAGSIEASLLRNKNFSCEDCATVFELNEKIDVNFFIKNKKNVLPCKSTYEICNIGRVVMANYLKTSNISHFDYEKYMEYDEEWNKILTSLHPNKF